MSKLYADLKSNIDNINSILSDKVKTEKFLQSGSWTAPFSGEISLFGCGKGIDARDVNVGDEILVEDNKITSYSGGTVSYPTEAKCNVVSGTSYNIWLAESDSQVYPIPPYSPYSFGTSMSHCVFGNCDAILGEIKSNPITLLYESARSQAVTIDDYRNETSDRTAGKVLTLIQKAPYIVNPRQKTYGVGGMGFAGKIQVIENHPNVQTATFKVLDVYSHAEKGNTGFLEISYPYQGELLSIFEDEFV